jgi:hypothetical protein
MKKIIFSVVILFSCLITQAQFWSQVGAVVPDQRGNVVYADSTTNALYVGGFFTTPANRIAKWDGISLSNLGTGMNGQVLSIVRYNGNLYAGGNFATAGGTIASCIAKWNGSAWSTVGTGMSAGTDVDALCVYNGELYAGGNFTTAGGNSVTAIAKWNGTTWSAVGTGMSINATVHALVVFNNELYAGGNFTTAGGVPANNIAKWNGTSWSAAGTGMDSRVQALHVWNGNLYAGGGFTTAGGSSANHLAKWNGSVWSAVGTGFNGWIYSIGSYNGELYAGGNFTTAGGASIMGISKWNGAGWSNVNEGFNGEVSSLTVYKGRLFAAGSMGYVVPYFAQWDNIPPGTNRFQKVYKGTANNNETVYDVQQTVDWGYVLTGHTMSYGAGGGDGYIIKTDTAGVISWAKSWGGNNFEQPHAVTTTSDGSIIFTGLSQTYGAGSNDVFAVSMDKNGTTNWARVYGTSASEQGWGIKEISNGGFVMSGTIGSDALLLRTISSGNITWTKKYGTTNAELINSLELTSSGGYLLAGTTGTSPNNNMYVLNIDANGTLLWDRTIGGTGEENGFMAKQTTDGGILVAGMTSSYGTGTDYDAYLVKLNSAGTLLWSKTYGTTRFEVLHDLEQTNDGGYLLTGYVYTPPGSNFDALAIKISSNGTLISAKSYGSGNQESAVSSDYCTDGGLILVSQSNGFPYSGGLDYNIYMVKTDSVLNSGSCHQNNETLNVNSPSSTVVASGSASSAAGLVELAVSPTETNCPFKTFELNPAISISKTNVACYNGTNGQASAGIAGGIPPYTYLWSNNATTTAISGLTANNYSITVTDSTLCSVTQTVTISQPQNFSLFTIVNSVSCFNGNDGSIDISLSGGTMPYTYSWSGGKTTEDISNLTIGSYSLAITDASGCTMLFNTTVYNSIPTVPICLVSVDSISSDSNLIVWEKPVSLAIDSFRIYRNISSVMTRIASRPYSAISMYVDTSSGINPKVQAYEYAISVIDTCGNESALSPHHITIHMVTPAFTPPTTFDLQWSDYQGFSFTDYEIWRDGNNNGNWVKIGTVLYTLSNQYTDLTAPSDSARYRIMASPSQPCAVTLKNPDPLAATVKSSKSNSSEKIVAPVSIAEVPGNSLISVSPNPSNGTFTVSNGKYEIIELNIYNLLGENVFYKNVNAKKTDVAIPDIAKGVYHLQVVTPSGIVNRKIVISK